MKEISFNFTKQETGLFISLFYADNGEGYSDEEIEKANEFITENQLLSLTDVVEMGDQCKCIFIKNNSHE